MSSNESQSHVKTDERDIVTQAELRRLYQLEQEAMDAWDKFENTRNSIVMRLKAHSMQAPGKRRLQRKSWGRRVVGWKGVCVQKNGQNFADKILEETPRRKYLGFRWETEGVVNVGNERNNNEEDTA